MGVWCREVGAGRLVPAINRFLVLPVNRSPAWDWQVCGGPCKALASTRQQQRPLGPSTGLISGRMDYNVVFSMGQR
jgi:hypothetical protein